MGATLEGPAQVPKHSTSAEGDSTPVGIWQEVVAARGYEGLVAKDTQLPDVGGRTLKWLKVKQPGYGTSERCTQ